MEVGSQLLLFIVELLQKILAVFLRIELMHVFRHVEPRQEEWHEVGITIFCSFPLAVEEIPDAFCGGLIDDQTLKQAEVKDGDVVRLIPEITAGGHSVHKKKYSY